MRVKSFDCLRGYGAIGIFLCHMPRLANSTTGYYFNWAMFQFNVGYFLIDLFFVMSGFLITSIILKDKEKNTFSFKRFYTNRALRIFPIYYITLLLVTIFITSEGFIYSLFFISNYYFAFNVHVHPLNNVWTLAVEEHFYLLWPFLLTSFNRRNCQLILGIGVPLLTLLTVLIAPAIYGHEKSQELIILGTTSRWLSISLGSLLAFHAEWLKNMSGKTSRWIAGICIASYLLFYFMPVIPVLKNIPNYARLTCLVPEIALLIIIVWYRFDQAKNFLIRKLLLNRIAQQLGMMSYGIYLFHYPVLYYFNMVDWQTPETNDPLKYWSMIFLVLAIAAFSYRFIETPLLNLKKKSYSIKKPAAMPAEVR